MRTSVKYLVNSEFTNTVHGMQSCISCHGGNDVDNMEKAHEGMNPAPAEDTDLCVSCHSDIGDTFETSLHATGNGQKMSLDHLSGAEDFFEKHPEASEEIWADCASCHPSCSECHISRPDKVKGGLLDQHMITTDREIIMEENCYNCHGARSAGEFVGNVAGEAKPADVHYKKGMTCMDCHEKSNVHGSGQEETEMYELDTLPRCVDCHSDVESGSSNIPAHNVHPEDTMSCQVCHSWPTNNCSNCHSGESTLEREFSFKIGKNPNPDELHPEKYIVVRHVPTVEDSFRHAGIEELEGYDQVPNWKMATPHNISKLTRQNYKCNNCHGNEDKFLTEDDLLPSDSEANKKLIVNKIPPKLDK